MKITEAQQKKKEWYWG